MAEAVAFAARYRRTPGTLWRRVLDEVLLFPPDATEPLSITKPGALVWTLLAEPISVADLVDQVATRFDAPRAQVQIDLEGLVAHLLTAGAICAVHP